MKATNARVEVEISITELREFIKEKTGVDVSEMNIEEMTIDDCTSEDNLILCFTKYKPLEKLRG